MCLLFFSYRTTPGYELVVAANRDEFLARSTAPLGYLDPEKTILGGRDQLCGGTWLGISAEMRFAAITNYRDPVANRPDAPSRGGILLEFLMGKKSPGKFLEILAQEASAFNGFNLIVGDSRELYYYTNRLHAPQLLAPGFYGLSNHLLDTPWPKVRRGKELLRPHMVEANPVDHLKLLELLADRHQPPDNQLPTTGVGLAWERLLGTIFINGSDYGTRSSAVITVTESGRIEFTEKTLHREGEKDLRPELVCLTFNT
ncbi:MAG: NRDE family protein [Desulforhopalus sp.]|nr:NRDE family protein [Desulforhopalus sp.]